MRLSIIYRGSAPNRSENRRSTLAEIARESCSRGHIRSTARIQHGAYRYPTISERSRMRYLSQFSRAEDAQTAQRSQNLRSRCTDCAALGAAARSNADPQRIARLRLIGGTPKFYAGIFARIFIRNGTTAALCAETLPEFRGPRPFLHTARAYLPEFRRPTCACYTRNIYII